MIEDREKHKQHRGYDKRYNIDLIGVTEGRRKRMGQEQYLKNIKIFFRTDGRVMLQIQGSKTRVNTKKAILRC